jgi:ATP-dependent exoDNAse (exonuclease V) beta subunit
MTKLTPQQTSAIKSPSPRICVVAGPGSGKTLVLVERFLALIRRGIRPDRIIAITFTEKAAAEMKERIVGRLIEERLFSDRRLLEEGYVGTFHGLCARVLRDFALEAGIPPEFRILEENEAGILRHLVFSELILELGEGIAPLLLNFRRPNEIERAVMAAHSRLYGVSGNLLPRQVDCLPEEGNTNWDVELLEEMAHLERSKNEESKERFERLGERYAEDALVQFRRLVGLFDSRFADSKRQERVLDFDDLQIFATRLLLENTDARRQVLSGFDHLLVDEYQDTNRIQDRLVDILSEEKSLFIVGDENQSIYRFRDAEVELFREKRGSVLANGGTSIDLSANFRSRPEIVEFINVMADWLWPDKDHELYSEMGFSGKNIPSVDILLIPKQNRNRQELLEIEANEVCSWIKETVESKSLRMTAEGREGTPPGYSDFAVLFRVSRSMIHYENALRSLGVPFSLFGGFGFLDRPEIEDLVSLLRAVIDRDDTSLVSLLRSPMFGVSDDCLITLARKKRHESLRSFAECLRKAESSWFSSDDWSKVSSAKRILNSAFVMSPFQPASHVIERALEETLYEEKVAALGGERAVSNIRKFVHMASSMERQGKGSCMDFIAFLRKQSELGGREAQAELMSQQSDSVTLSTIHSFKGLQSPVVVLADMGRSERGLGDWVITDHSGRMSLRFGNPLGRDKFEPSLFMEMKNKETAECRREEERIFYVAMTRAEEHLVLAGSANPGKSPGKKSGVWMNWVRSAIGLSDSPSGQVGESRKTESADLEKDQAASQRNVAGKSGGELVLPPGGSSVVVSQQMPSYTDPAVDEAPDIQEAGSFDLGPLYGRLDALDLNPVAASSNGKLGVQATHFANFAVCPLLYVLKDVFDLELQRGVHSKDEQADSTYLAPGQMIPYRGFEQEVGSAAHDLLQRLDFRQGSGKDLAVLAKALKETAYSPDVVERALELSNRFIDSEIFVLASKSDWLEKEISFSAMIDGRSYVYGRADLVFEFEGVTYVVDYKTDSSFESWKSSVYENQIRAYGVGIKESTSSSQLELYLSKLSRNPAEKVEFEESEEEKIRLKLGEMAVAIRQGRFGPSGDESCADCSAFRLCPRREIFLRSSNPWENQI